MSRSFDRDSLDSQLLLSLPMREGAGTLGTADVAKPHHPVLMTHAPAWTQLSPSGAYCLAFDGANDYMSCLGASSADLDFTSGDFSIACWAYLTVGSSDILVGRYLTDVSGWEVYFTEGPPTYFNLRCHHGGVPARTSANCQGWVASTWTLFGISRSGAYPLFYFNGIQQAMSYDAGGIQNPVTDAHDLVIGINNGKNANHLNGRIQGLRIWGRCLTPLEQRSIWLRERHLFGV